jgi:hypothetical protein
MVSCAFSTRLATLHLTILFFFPNRFLLHYTARDVVDLLSQGIGGATEMRDQAVQYFENNTGPTATPLFGIVQVRRRRVLVKVLPGTSSRLIQGKDDLSLVATRE